MAPKAVMPAEPDLSAAGLYRLMAWLSPSYPVGAFSHSHGLEWVVERGVVREATSCGAWIEDVMRHGGGRQDAILLAAAWRAARRGDRSELEEVSDLAAALTPSRERRLETLSQGSAFALATAATWGPDSPAPETLAYPVALAMAAADHEIPLEPTVAAYLHAFGANLVSAGVRLVPLGQTAGQRLIAELEPVVAEVAAEAIKADLDNIGGCAFLADIASMCHETQYTRLFRT